MTRQRDVDSHRGRISFASTLRGDVNQSHPTRGGKAVEAWSWPFCPLWFRRLRNPEADLLTIICVSEWFFNWLSQTARLVIVHTFVVLQHRALNVVSHRPQLTADTVPCGYVSGIGFGKWNLIISDKTQRQSWEYGIAYSYTVAAGWSSNVGTWRNFAVRTK
jgi:hypothetical protein